MGPSSQLQQYLEETHTPYAVHQHGRSLTALQLAETEHIDPHEVAKVVILRDKKQHYMMVIPGDFQLDLKAAREFIGSPDAALAPEEELAKLFPDCELGAMPPFGPLYHMPVYAEQALSDDTEIEFHAGSHQAAIRISFANWQQMVKPKLGHFAYKMH